MAEYSTEMLSKNRFFYIATAQSTIKTRTHGHATRCAQCRLCALTFKSSKKQLYVPLEDS